MSDEIKRIGEYIQGEFDEGKFVLMLSIDLEKIQTIILRYGHSVELHHVTDGLRKLSKKDTDHVKSFVVLKTVNNILERIAEESSHIMNALVADEQKVRQ